MFGAFFNEIRPAGLLALAILSGCAHALSPGIRQEARRDIDFPTVLENPTRYAGSIVIWGGIIIDTRVGSETTDVVILETPLGHGEEPVDRPYSRGRFIATTAAYLDPAVYRPGLKITVGGEVVGREVRPLGESRYAYPVVRLIESRLWEPGFPYGYFGPSFSIGLGWFWGGGHHHHVESGFRGGVRGRVR